MMRAMPYAHRSRRAMTLLAALTFMALGAGLDHLWNVPDSAAAGSRLPTLKVTLKRRADGRTILSGGGVDRGNYRYRLGLRLQGPPAPGAYRLRLDFISPNGDPSGHLSYAVTLASGR